MPTAADRPPHRARSAGRHRRVRAVALLGLAIAGTLTACSPSPERPSDFLSSTSTPASVPDLASARAVVLVGDSLAQQAAPYLQPLLGDRAFVPQFFGGTAPCDWLGRDLGATADSVVILSFVGNSSTPCMSDGRGGFLRGTALVERYRTDLTALVAQVQATGARVLLVGQPQRVGVADVQVEVDGLDAVYAELVEVATVSFVDAGAAVEDAFGAFTRTLPCLAGEAACGPDGTNVVRSDDGVHFCPGANPTPCDVYSSGAFRFASAIAGAVNAA